MSLPLLSWKCKTPLVQHQANAQLSVSMSCLQPPGQLQTAHTKARPTQQPQRGCKPPTCPRAALDSLCAAQRCPCRCLTATSATPLAKCCRHSLTATSAPPPRRQAAPPGCLSAGRPPPLTASRAAAPAAGQGGHHRRRGRSAVVCCCGMPVQCLEAAVLGRLAAPAERTDKIVRALHTLTHPSPATPGHPAFKMPIPHPPCAPAARPAPPAAA